MADAPRSVAFVAAVIVARVAAVLFAAVSVLGFLWFLGTHDAGSVAYFIATVVALLAFAAYPRAALSASQLRVLLIALAGIAVATTVFQMYRDLMLVNGADYPAFWLRT